METTIFADKIFYIEGLIKNPAGVIESLESSDPELLPSDAITPWQNWIASGGGSDVYVFGQIKHTDDNKIEDSSEDVKYIYRAIRNSLNKAGREYCTANNIDYFDPAPISISKYVEGASMGAHVDSYDQLGVEPVMSAVVYLNDDYEGGELNFPEQNVTIKPKAGSIIVFPSTAPFYHQSLPVISGVKYISPAFWIRKL